MRVDKNSLAMKRCPFALGCKSSSDMLSLLLYIISTQPTLPSLDKGVYKFVEIVEGDSGTLSLNLESISELFKAVRFHSITLAPIF